MGKDKKKDTPSRSSQSHDTSTHRHGHHGQHNLPEQNIVQQVLQNTATRDILPENQDDQFIDPMLLAPWLQDPVGSHQIEPVDTGANQRQSRRSRTRSLPAQEESALPRVPTPVLHSTPQPLAPRPLAPRPGGAFQPAGPNPFLPSSNNPAEPTHTKTDTSPASTKKFSCFYCGRPFDKNWHRKEHMKHACTKKTVTLLECSICKKTFSTRSSLKHHEDNHVDKNIKCEECGENVKNQEGMRYHYKKFHKDKKKACPICKHQVYAQGHKCREMKKELTAQDLTCPKCGYCFSSKGNLERHLNGLCKGQPKKEACPECGDQFSRKEDLRKHLRRGRCKGPKKT